MSDVNIGGVPHSAATIEEIGGPFNENQILFGHVDGSIEQSANWRFEDTHVHLTDGFGNVGLGQSIFGAITTGTNNVAIGNTVATNLIDAINNVAIGYKAYVGRTDAEGTIAIGYMALYGSSAMHIANIAIGDQAGRGATGTGEYGPGDIFIGDRAGKYSEAGTSHISIGSRAGYRAGGNDQIFIGRQAGYVATGANGNNSIGIGTDTLRGLTGSSCVYNIAIGTAAGRRISSGHRNVCVGQWAGGKISSGDHNIAMGYRSLYGTGYHTGNNNIAIGQSAMDKGNTGHQNIAIGLDAMAGLNTVSGTGDNVAIGTNAMRNLSTGQNNVALAEGALRGVTIGTRNIGIGDGALQGVTDGGRNIGIGGHAGYTLDGSYNIVIGVGAGGSVDGNGNVCIGHLAGNNMLTGTKNVLIGYDATNTGVNDSNKLIIANSTTTRSLVRGDFSAGYFRIHGIQELSHPSVGGAGRVSRYCITDTISPSIDVDSAITIPAGANLIGVSFWVTLAVTTSGATDTWAADFITGSTTALVTAGTSGALNTKVDTMVPSEITTAGTKIRFDAPGAETFTGGLIQIQVYYETLSSMT